MVGFGSRICDGIGRYGNTGVSPIDFPLGDPAGANLADMWSLDCAEAVNVRGPTWSPDGTLLALFIAPGASGRGDWDRKDALYDLDVLDLATGSITPIMSGLRDGLQIAWSPDGTTLAALTGTARIVGTDTWLVPVAGGRAQRLALADDGSLSAVAWSPDGARLAGLINRSDPESFTHRFEPVIIRLADERHGADLDGSPLPTGLEERSAPGT